MYYGSGAVDRIASWRLSWWQHFSAWNNVMVAILKVWCHIRN